MSQWVKAFIKTTLPSPQKNTIRASPTSELDYIDFYSSFLVAHLETTTGRRLFLIFQNLKIFNNYLFASLYVTTQLQIICGRLLHLLNPVCANIDSVSMNNPVDLLNRSYSRFIAFFF